MTGETFMHGFSGPRFLARILGLSSMLAMLWALPAVAAVPLSTWVEGALFASGGGPVADGNYNITFSLYKDATTGTPSWLEGPVALAVKGGLFSHVLGSTKAIDVATTAALGATPFLAMKIDSDAELPRKPVSSVLFSVRAAVAESVDCSGCIAASALDPNVLKAYPKATDLSPVAKSGKYSDLVGGPDLSPYALLSKLAAVASSGKYADLVGAPVLANVALSGKYADLAGAPVLAKIATSGSYADLGNVPVHAKVGDKCGTGLVLQGIKADGSYDCVPAFDPANLPADVLDEVSNNMLTTQFNDLHPSITTPINIPDHVDSGVKDTIVVPDLGISQGISITVDLTNSDISTITLLLVAPDGSKFTLYDKSGKKGDPLKATFTTTTTLPAGDLKTLTGKNPKGTWTLTVVDSGFLNNLLDGKLNSWSVGVKNLSSSKVAANGLFQFKVATAAPIACTPANFGAAYANSKDNALYICNGKDFYPISMVAIGTNANPGFSCKDILAKAPASSDGIYWVTGNGSSPFQAYCDMVTDGGGWTLVLNLDTSDANNRHYDDTTFWTAKNTVSTPDVWANSDFKSKAFETVGGTALMMRLHNGGKFKAFATYNLLPTYGGQTLHYLFNNVSNATVSGPRVNNAGSVGSAGYERNAGDAFADQKHAIIMNSTYQPNDATNVTRFGTNYGDQCATINCNGHNFGGWGGRHYRAGWGAYYEGAALNGYCSSQGGFGSNGSAYNGNDAFNGCTPKYQDVDLAVFVR